MPAYLNATAVPRDELTDVIMESTTTDEMFSGLKLLPALPLTQVTGHVPKIEIGTGQQMRAARKTRRPGSHFDRWQTTIKDYSITLVQIGEELPVPDEVAMTYEDYFDVESVYTLEAGTRLRRGHEIDSETAVFDTGSFTNATNSSIAYTVANILTMDVPGDILAAIRRVKALGNAPDTIAIPGIVWDRIRLSKLLKEFIVGTIGAGAQVTANTLARAFADEGIKQVFILDAYVNESDADNADVINPIWPVTYIFVGKISGGALKSGGVGRTFYWDKEGPVFNVTTYRDETVKSNIIRAQKTTLCAIANAKAGTLITTQYS